MNFRISLLLASLPSLAVLSSAAPDRVAAATSGITPDRGDMVLFPLDDVSIPWRNNLKLTLQRPEKYAGNPVLRAGPSEGPDGLGCDMYGTVMKQDGKYRMWYYAALRPDSRIPGDLERVDVFNRQLAYAESTDGIHWVRPNLSLVEFRGNKNNNLILIEPTDDPYAKGYCCSAVIFDPSDPDPAWRYKMAYILEDRQYSEASTATAASPDGLRWKLVSNTMSLTKGHFENFSLIRFRGIYYLSGQNIPPFDAGLADGSPAGRVMKSFFSPDFHHWSEGRALDFYRSDYVPKPTYLGEENHEGGGLWNRGNVILGLYGRWHGGTIISPAKPGEAWTDERVKGLKIELGLFVSNDAIHFREPVRNFVMVPCGSSEEWDAEALLQANAFANTDTQTLIWYSVWDTSTPFDDLPPLPAPLPESAARKASSVGLVTLPRDRFGSFSKLLRVSEHRRPEFNAKIGASCLTRSLKLHDRSQLFVNVDDVSPSAALAIALVNDAEVPLDGYTAQLSANSLKAPVEWAGGQSRLPVNSRFRIKVTWPVEVDDAKLYALYIEHL